MMWRRDERLVTSSAVTSCLHVRPTARLTLRLTAYIILICAWPEIHKRAVWKEIMPTDVIMPQMGESIFEGTITKWLKKPGDKVQRDEPLFEISTDKVDAEIPAPAPAFFRKSRSPKATPCR